MDYPYSCAKFGDFSFSRFGFIVGTVSDVCMIAILTRLPSERVIKTSFGSHDKKSLKQEFKHKSFSPRSNQLIGGDQCRV